MGEGYKGGKGIVAELATFFKDKSLALKLRLFNVVSECHKLIINLAILFVFFL